MGSKDLGLGLGRFFLTPIAVLAEITISDFKFENEVTIHTLRH